MNDQATKEAALKQIGEFLDGHDKELSSIIGEKIQKSSALGQLNREWRKSVYTISFALAAALVPIILNFTKVMPIGHYPLFSFLFLLAGGVCLSYLEISEVEKAGLSMNFFDELELILNKKKRSLFLLAETVDKTHLIEYDRLEIDKQKVFLARERTKLSDARVNWGNDLGLGFFILGLFTLSRGLMPSRDYFIWVLAALLVVMGIIFTISYRKAGNAVGRAKEISRAKIKDAEDYIKMLEDMVRKP